MGDITELDDWIEGHLPESPGRFLVDDWPFSKWGGVSQMVSEHHVPGERRGVVEVSVISVVSTVSVARAFCVGHSVF